MVAGFLLGVCLGGLGIYCLWSSLLYYPARYDRLEATGIHATAQLGSCHFGKDSDCDLTLTYQGQTRTWSYGHGAEQFKGIRQGGAVPVVVDSENPRTVYTLHDVERRSGTSVVLVIYGATLLGIGLLILYFFIRFRHSVLLMFRIQPTLYYPSTGDKAG